MHSIPSFIAETARPREARESPGRAARAARLPEIDPARCTGCGRCVAACEPRLLSLETARWLKFSVLSDAERCTGCSLCAVKCPFRAITMRTPAAAADHHRSASHTAEAT